MTSLREAAQQALEALETKGEHHPRVYAAITALRAALAEPVQESVHEHEKWCASVTQLLLCYPPRKAPCNCKKKVAEPVQEPVAWRWGYRSITTGEMDWRGYVEIPSHPNLRSPAIIMEPLYTAPPQRKPLTEEEIKRIDDSTHFHESPDWSLRFARAIEKAHGIGGNT